jgi:hypothetical protein
MRGILNRQARRRRPELSATQADRDMQRGNSLPGTVALAFLNPTSPKPGLMLFRQTGSGLPRERAGTSDAAAPRQHPIRSLNPASSTCAARSK